MLYAAKYFSARMNQLFATPLIFYLRRAVLLILTTFVTLFALINILTVLLRGVNPTFQYLTYLENSKHYLSFYFPRVRRYTIIRTYVTTRLLFSTFSKYCISNFETNQSSFFAHCILLSVERERSHELSQPNWLQPTASWLQPTATRFQKARPPSPRK